MGSFQTMPHHVYTQPPNNGLKSILINDISVSSFRLGSHVRYLTRLDLMLLVSLAVELLPIPGWACFNQIVTESQDTGFFEISDIVTLPFINLNPSDLSTIYTALQFANNEISLHNKQYCIVTFDQPIFIKAVDIVWASQDLFQSVIVRLGGLHMTFSFMESDGHINSGSGQEQFWETVYASGSVPQMMNGHSYKRAIRANILTAQSIMNCIMTCSPFEINDLDKVAIQRKWDDLLNEVISLQEALESTEFVQLVNLVEKKIADAEALGRTAKLWIKKRERLCFFLTLSGRKELVIGRYTLQQ